MPLLTTATPTGRKVSVKVIARQQDELKTPAGFIKGALGHSLWEKQREIATDLTNNEIAKNMANALLQIGPTNDYSTPAQNIAALQAWWATATGWPAAQMGNFINSLNLSDVSLENVFGVSAGAQLTALKNRLTTCAATYAAGMASAGQ